MEQFKQEFGDFSQSPKILEYIERVKNGETVESFGDIPESWKREIENGLQERTESIKTEDTVLKEKKIEDLKKDIYEIAHSDSNLEDGNVINTLRSYLLSKINERFTKEAARTVAENNIQKASDKELFAIALEQFYQETRVGKEYERSPLFDIDVESITREPNYLIKRVQDENGWHYRVPKTGTSANKSESRISLNVWGNKELVRRLDTIAYKYGVIYKTPAQSDAWNERNDPVTIYINNPNLTPEQIEQLKNEIVTETQPYVRSNEGFGIYGDNIATGVEFGLESSITDITRLKEEAKNISPELYDAFDEYLRKDGKEKSSVGMNIAAQKLLDLFK